MESFLTKILTYGNPEKVDAAYYSKMAEKLLPQFEQNLPRGYTIDTSLDGIKVTYCDQKLVVLKKDKAICNVCGFCYKCEISNNFEVGLKHVKACFDEFHAKIDAGVCTVCDRHWFSHRLVKQILSVEHVVSDEHQRNFQNVLAAKNYGNYKRSYADMEVVELFNAKRYLASEPIEESVKKRYLAASLELLQSAPEYDLQGKLGDEKRALSIQLGGLTPVTIMRLIRILEGNVSEGEEIFREQCGLATEEDQDSYHDASDEIPPKRGKTEA